MHNVSMSSDIFLPIIATVMTRLYHFVSWKRVGRVLRAESVLDRAGYVEVRFGPLTTDSSTGLSLNQGIADRNIITVFKK